MQTEKVSSTYQWKHTRRLQCETGQKWPGTVAQMLKHRIIFSSSVHTASTRRIRRPLGEEMQPRLALIMS